jgi:hypothetical protein
MVGNLRQNKGGPEMIMCGMQLIGKVCNCKEQGHRDYGYSLAANSFRTIFGVLAFAANSQHVNKWATDANRFEISFFITSPGQQSRL